MLPKPLKWAILLIAIYFFYKTFILKKEDFDLVPAIGPNGTITDVKNLLPGVFYQRATLKDGVRNTETPALNGGSTCTEFPSTIYIPVTPVDAVCNLGTNNIKAYAPITETLAQCPIVNGVPIKTLNKINDVNAFNNATTTTQAQFGGRDCFTQRQAALPSTSQFPCTSSIQSSCDLATVTKVYNPSSVADSFSTCNVNVGGVFNKAIGKWSDSEINTRATLTSGINGGATCSAQAATLPATANFPCGPIQSSCDLATITKVYNPSSVSDNFSTCNVNVGGVFNKAISKWSDSEINARATTTAGINGGSTCSAQAATLPATRNFPCGPINSDCDLATDTKVYNPSSVSDTFSTCSINVGGVWNKSIAKLTPPEIDTRATRTAAINGGATCSAQAATLPANKNFPCGPVNASCVGNDPSGIKSNVNSNYNVTTNLMNTPIIDTSAFWSTCKPPGYTLGSNETFANCCSRKSTGGFSTGISISGMPSFGAIGSYGGATSTSTSTSPNVCI
jgi:hypothetical protein